MYGVDYDVYQDVDGGELFVTKYGRPLLDQLQPDQWFQNARYASEGVRQWAGTGAVYKFSLADNPAHPVDIIVKFSRFAQEVSLDIQATFGDAIDPDAIDRARFLDPFREFGMLRELRRGTYGPKEIRVMTKRALAIYKAPQIEPLWRLGRKASFFNRAQHALTADQAHKKDQSDSLVQLELDHVYVELFHWVQGMSLAEATEAGLITQDQADEYTQIVADELLAKGFRVLDHKPHHVIVRPHGDGLLHHDGKLVYVLVDFELLERTEAYEHHLRMGR